MKTTLATIVMALFSVVLFAKGDETGNYVITKSDTVFCSNVKVGLLKTTVTLANGEKSVYKNSDIMSFKTNGKIFDKMPVYYQNKPTNKTANMELVAQSCGHRLYKHTVIEGTGINRNGNFTGGTGEVDVYLVYKNQEFIVQLDEKNSKGIMKFFGLEK